MNVTPISIANYYILELIVTEKDNEVWSVIVSPTRRNSSELIANLGKTNE